MTADHTSPPPDGEPTCVVVDLGPAPYDEPRLELHGPLDEARLQAALGRAAVHLPGASAPRHRVDRYGPGHHTLRLATEGADRPGGTFPFGLLADLLTGPAAPPARSTRTLAPTPLMRELLADADAHPGRHVERLSWAWHGPLDPDRFRAAWQSVVDHESVLRAAFDDGPDPQLVLHDHVDADVLWLPHGSLRWDDLVERDLRRGLDPRRPGGPRVTALGGGPAGDGTPTPARVLLTYHHALLDDLSARLLLREFYRAYLAGGRLPGGERRPDLRDYVHWLGRQDTAPPREFWSAGAPPAAALSPVPYGAPPGPADTGRTRVRLTADQTERLAAWAARLGSAESGVLQAVWAVLLYRAAGADGTATIRFGVTASGRGILFEGADRLPAALRTPLPLGVEVDPGRTVAGLLAELRDRVLDMTSYEWVSPRQIRGWSAPGRTTATDPAHGPPAGDRPPDGSLLVFEHGPRPADDLSEELAALGVRVERPDPLGARTAFPVTLVAHHGDGGGLVLTASYDRGPHTDVAEALTHTALLLRELPYLAGDTTTVADLLRLLAGAGGPAGRRPVPREAPGPAGPRSPLRPAETGEPADLPLVPLRLAAEAGAGVVCLVQTHGTPRSRYTELAAAYRGPESIVLLRSVPGGVPARHSALRPLTDRAGLLVLGAFSGGGGTAYEIARLIGENGGRPPLVVLTGASTGAAPLARMLETAAARAGRH
ncbi:condensation domain-containing protein [Streptomyces sp. NPDC003456]|uniref:condensation domain-containing protein n=1 Tax=Streptomyces sp. NPDC003456 TaxID=3364683 RepID=UPI0036959B13